MTQLFKVMTLMLVLPVLVLCQSRSEQPRRHKSAPVVKILRPVLQKIRKQANAPILLPSKLPSSVNENEIHFVGGEGKSDGWEISLYYKEGCGDACFVGYFEAKRDGKVSRDEVDRVVRLVNGISGYYTARSCGASCAPPQINWMDKGVMYTIQFKVNNRTKKHDEAEVIALANSAIQGGAR